MSTQNDIASTRKARLRAWMDKYQIDQSGLAQRLDVGKAYVSLLLAGRSVADGGKHFGEKSARSIEAKLGLYKGYLDESSGAAPLLQDWDKPEQLPDGVFATVPMMSIALSADGALVTKEKSVPPLVFSKEWLVGKSVTSRSNLVVMDVHGDSMANYLMDGDVALIDTGQKTVADNLVYAIRYFDDLRIKRVIRLFDGGLIIRSDNIRYADEQLTPQKAPQLVVIGKMIWRAG